MLNDNITFTERLLLTQGEPVRNGRYLVIQDVTCRFRASLRAAFRGRAQILRKRDKCATKWLITLLGCAGENNGLIIRSVILCMVEALLKQRAAAIPHKMSPAAA